MISNDPDVVEALEWVCTCPANTVLSSALSLRRSASPLLLLWSLVRRILLVRFGAHVALCRVYSVRRCAAQWWDVAARCAAETTTINGSLDNSFRNRSPTKRSSADPRSPTSIRPPEAGFQAAAPLRKGGKRDARGSGSPCNGSPACLRNGAASSGDCSQTSSSPTSVRSGIEVKNMIVSRDDHVELCVKMYKVRNPPLPIASPFAPTTLFRMPSSCPLPPLRFSPFPSSRR